MKCINKKCKALGTEQGDRRTCPKCGTYMDPVLARLRNERSRKNVAAKKAQAQGAKPAAQSTEAQKPNSEAKVPDPLPPSGPAGATPGEPAPAVVDKAATAEAFPSWDDYKKNQAVEKPAAPAAPSKPVSIPWTPPVRLICIELNKFLDEPERLKEDEIAQLEAAAASLGFQIQPREGDPIVLPWWAPVLIALAIIILPRAPKLVASAMRKWKAHQAEKAAEKAAKEKGA